MRVGMGFDAHRFESARPLVLGGVSFPGEPGLAGHSDADVVCHALIDAVLGAAGLGDCGSAFPDTTTPPVVDPCEPSSSVTVRVTS